MTHCCIHQLINPVS